jgi:hypothetical protein
MGDAPATPQTADAELELCKTRLRVVGGDLIRLNEKGGIAMRLPLDEIEDVASVYRIEPLGPIFLLLALGIGAVAYYVSQYNILTTLLYIVALGLMALSIPGFLNRVIAVRARTGTTAIGFSDSWDEASGFVTSLRRLIGRSEAAASERSKS